MTKEKKAKPVFVIECERDETEEQAFARTMLSPALQSAATIQSYLKSPVELDLEALINCLDKQVDLHKDGSLKRIDQMLLSQAHTLDAIANNLFRRAIGQEYMRNLESYLKLGLRAQNQCRATLEALVSMKKPTHLSQTNIGYNQQVNNAPNELLEKCDERMDTGSSQEAVGGDRTLETVGTEHRPEDT